MPLPLEDRKLTSLFAVVCWDDITKIKSAVPHISVLMLTYKAWSLKITRKLYCSFFFPPESLDGYSKVYWNRLSALPFFRLCDNLAKTRSRMKMKVIRSRSLSHLLGFLFVSLTGSSQEPISLDLSTVFSCFDLFPFTCTYFCLAGEFTSCYFRNILRLPSSDWC